MRKAFCGAERGTRPHLVDPAECVRGSWYAHRSDEDFTADLVLEVGTEGAQILCPTWDPILIRGWERLHEVLPGFEETVRSVIEDGYDDGTRVYDPYR